MKTSNLATRLDFDAAESIPRQPHAPTVPSDGRDGVPSRAARARRGAARRIVLRDQGFAPFRVR